MSIIRLCLVLHNHQPVGNFEGVIEEAYQDSYLPFLDVFEQYPQLKISLHTSGPLLEWMDANHPDYLDRLAALVAVNRLEIIGGAFYEPILTMLPSADRIGQIQTYRAWLEHRLEAKVRGLWLPERVWEQALTRDLVDAGVEYTLLDDLHFRNAGLTNEELTGAFLTDDDGRLLRLFPGSEQLRYMIPFAEPDQTIAHLREMRDRHPNSVAVFGDDGEKFGSWPDTKAHVYEHGWLRRFFDALVENQDWLKTATLAEATDEAPTAGRVYIPDGSYREMTEWVLPVDRHAEFEELVHSFEHDERWPQLKRFLRGGFWRNFRVRYEEANELYCRMLLVSNRLNRLAEEGASGDLFEQAVRALYRGQCNCPYWHGAFGGIYLPHLRNAIYRCLIEAEKLLDEVEGKTSPRVEATADDYDLDGRQEVRLSTDQCDCFVAPARGGQIYELDVRSIEHNLLATMTRRPEAYHRKVLAHQDQANQDVASIHDRVVFKQEGLDQRLQYDSYQRNSLIDHFFGEGVSVQAVSENAAPEIGDFVHGAFDAKIRRDEGRVQLQMHRDGNVAGLPVGITKAITVQTGAASLQIIYMLEGLPTDRALHFGVEMNLAGLPSGADDRFFHAGSDRLGHLGEMLDIAEIQNLGLTDQWLGIDVRLEIDKPTAVWTFPVETVSQSEGGFELVHQSVALLPHWHVQGDANGRWAVTMHLHMDTQLAENRRLAHASTTEA